MSEARQVWCELHVARVVLEAVTPLSVTTGTNEGVFDTRLVRDADGLPAIPGTTLAGVLRSHARRILGEDFEADAFGARPADGRGPTPSRIEISWARLHGADDRPAPLRTDVSQDTLLAVLADGPASEPVVRDRVRLNHRGVADAAGRGKFDRSVLPKGARFTFDLRWWSTGSDHDRVAWRNLLGLLHLDSFAVGGATRSGLGRLTPVTGRLRSACFDLSTRDGISTFEAARHPETGWLAALERECKPDGPAEQPEPPEEAKRADEELRRVELSLEPQDYLRVGGSGAGIPTPDVRGQQPDLRPLTERVIVWQDGRGDFETWLIVPGSAIKGALRHRTVFHLGRILEQFAEETAGEIGNRVRAAEEKLFGSVKGRSGGQAGLVTVEDAFVQRIAANTSLSCASTMAHNSLDRFTGGVRDGFLFTEELPWRLGLIPVRIRIAAGASQDAARALDMALADLQEGRLTLGAGGGRGHGTLRIASGGDVV